MLHKKKGGIVLMLILLASGCLHGGAIGAVRSLAYRLVMTLCGVLGGATNEE